MGVSSTGGCPYYNTRLHPLSCSPWLNASTSFLLLTFPPLNLYRPSASIPWDSTNWRHLWTRMGIPLLVNCCSARGIPDTCVCLMADTQDSASVGLSALKWYALQVRYSGGISCEHAQYDNTIQWGYQL